MSLQPRLSRISVELAQRINDAVTSAGVAITTGDQDGTVLTAAQRMAYINKAMLKMIDDVWMAVKGDKKAFAQVFPELVKYRSITTGTGGSTGLYTIATPNLDFFQLLEATINNGSVVVQASVQPSWAYLSVLNSKAPQYKGDSSNPMCVEVAGLITFTPLASFDNKAATITILKLPINGYDGSFLQMTVASNLEDSPFLDSRNSRIASIAEELYRYDAKEN